MHVRLGTSPIAWSNDDLPELGGATPLETCLTEARAAGYAGIELGHKFPRAPAALAQVLAPHRLALISGWYGARLRERSAEAEIEALAPHLNLLAALKAPVLVFAEVSGSVQGRRDQPLAVRPRMSAAEWAVFAGRLATVAAHTRARGVQLAYHHHMGTVIETADEIGRLMVATSNDVGLLLDSGHLAFAGAEPAAVAARWAGRVVHFHAKDLRPAVAEQARREHWSFLDAVVAGVFTVPGDGALDFTATLEPLAQAGYQGWLVVEAEQDPAKAPPLPYARQGCVHLRQAAAAAGFVVEG